jgi:tetratricopeptide (TPR) repeat protein
LLCAVSLLPCRPAQALDPTPGYAMVQRAFLREDFTQAVQLARAFLLQSPTTPEASRVWLWLALSLDKLQQANESLRELDELKAALPPHDPLRPETLFWEGDISRRALQMLRAKLAYQRVLDRYPDSTWAAQARLGLGLIHLHQQAYDQALGHFRELATAQEGTSVGRDAALFQGLCHLRLQQLDEAVAVLERLLGRLQDPNLMAQAAFYLGESLSALGRYPEAAQRYERAIAAATTLQWSQPAHFGLGWAHYRTGRCEESLAAFDSYLQQPGDHQAEAMFAQGACLMRLGREAEAVERFETIVAQFPDHPLAVEAGFNLVDHYRREERFAMVKGLLHGFLRRRLTPQAQAQIRLRLAAIALDQGNAAQARTIFSLALDAADASVRQTAASGLGDVSLYLGRLPDAARWYEEAVRADPASALARYASYQLGRIQLQLGAFQDAVAIFQRLQASEDAALADDARLALVIAQINQREEAAARTLLAAIRGARPGSPIAARAAYYEALLALGHGEEAAARALCEQAIAGAPRSSEAFEARLLLEDLDAKDRPAREEMVRLEAIYTGERLSRNQRATLAKRLGDLARSDSRCPEAIRWYDQTMQMAPALSGEAEYRVASCYEEGGDLEAAMRWYQRIEQAPWHVRGQLALAKLLERQDRPQEAMTVYERVAAEPVPEAKLVQERLAALQARNREKEQRW